MNELLNQIAPLVQNITFAGAATAVFVYFSVKLWVKPWIETRYEAEWWKELAVNLCAGALGAVFALALVYLLVDITSGRELVIAALAGVLAAAVATYGHEAVSNYGKREQA